MSETPQIFVQPTASLDGPEIVITAGDTRAVFSPEQTERLIEVLRDAIVRSHELARSYLDLMNGGQS